MPALTIAEHPSHPSGSHLLPRAGMSLFLPWRPTQHPPSEDGAYGRAYGALMQQLPQGGQDFARLGCKQGAHVCDVATSHALDIPARPTGGVGGSVCSTPLLLGFTLVLLMGGWGRIFLPHWHLE